RWTKSYGPKVIHACFRSTPNFFAVSRDWSRLFGISLTVLAPWSVRFNSTRYFGIRNLPVSPVCGAVFEYSVRQAIASKLIELAKTGERNPDLLMRARVERNSTTAHLDLEACKPIVLAGMFVANPRTQFVRRICPLMAVSSTNRRNTF